MSCPICSQPVYPHSKGAYCQSCNMVFPKQAKPASRRKRKSLINHHFGGF